MSGMPISCVNDPFSRVLGFTTVVVLLFPERACHLGVAIFCGIICCVYVWCFLVCVMHFPFWFLLLTQGTPPPPPPPPCSILATSRGNAVLFHHEGGVEVGDVDSKALRVDVEIDATLSAGQARELVRNVPSDKQQ